MAKRPRKPNKSNEGTDRERHLLDQLKEIGSKVGLEVREERLIREVGYSVHSGRCVVKGQEVILLDRNAGISERTDALIQSLSGCDLTDIYLEPGIRRLIQSEHVEHEDGDSSDSSAGEDAPTETGEQSSGA